MAKESLYTPIKAPILREVFNSEFATIKNGGTPTDVTFNNGVGEFNGSSSLVNYGDLSKFNFGTDDFTIVIRLKTTSSGSNNPIMGKYPPTSSTGGFDINIEGNDKADFLIRADSTDGTYSRVTSVGTYNDGDWHVFVMTRTNNTIVGYVDGVSVGTNSSMTSGKSLSNTQDLVIGGRDTTTHFDGSIDFVSIYNRVLSAEEVESLYLNQLYKEPVRDLVGEWKLGAKDETKGETDMVVNGTFDTDTDWTKGTGWAISGGTANGTSANGTLNPSSAFLTVGKTYILSLDITSYTSGTLWFDSGPATTVKKWTSAGTKTWAFTAGGTNIRLYGGSINASIDNVSVKEIKQADLTGIGNNGNLYNFPATIPYTIGPYGFADTALTFDGSDDYINIGDISEYENDDYTASVWCKRASSGTEHIILTIQQQIAGADGIAGIIARYNSSDQLQVLTAIANSFETNTITTKTFPINKWHHILLTKEGTKMSIYVDGVFIKSITLSSSTVDYTTSGSLKTIIGAGWNSTAGGSYSSKFDGDIAYVKIFSRPIGAQEVRELYNEQGLGVNK